MTKKLSKDFYLNSAIEVAPALLGKILVRKLSNNNILRYRITETECYYGESDTACHAHCGKTNRNAIIYKEGGSAYIYLCYGIHNLLNVVTGPKDHPEAVLIRGVEKFNGPGKLTKAMNITRQLNGASLTDSDLLWIEEDDFKTSYYTDKRVGIDYATEEYRNIEWRFILKK